ncbi:glutamate receptor 2.7-like [Actinidia eriantha]|uniref:glutamate receptor 2.7-like n=1 Tax=Actinidia eriantha TaxID=165200 RepID=UPI00258D9630|nr:glutamate receptor 2.7-like [Actinidia eriantha]
MGTAHSMKVPVNVGVVLDKDAKIGKMGLRCISMALSDFYTSHRDYKTRIVLNDRDSKRSVVGAAVAAVDLLKKVEVQAIIGPVTSMQANFLINLGNEAHVPIISFSATSPFLSSLRSEFFIRASLNDSAQVNVITSIIQAFGWREVTPIYIDNEYGEGLIPFLTDALQQIDTSVPYRSIIHPSASDEEVVAELCKLMAMQTRVFVVHMFPSLSTRLFTKAKELGMMSEGYVWIITDGITNMLNTMGHLVIDSMQGVIGIKPYVPRTKRLKDFTLRWENKYQQEKVLANYDLTVFGLWAYDATITLAMAVERVWAPSFSFQSITNHSRNPSEFETFGVSQFGKDLSRALSSTVFRGLSGSFNFVNGQLQSSAFQIVNVLGNEERSIGFWTPKCGLVRVLKSMNTCYRYSASKNNLKSIIWPGDATHAPKGWVVPTSGRVLRIGVPIKDTGFSEFVRVTRDASTNITSVTGYCIDIFEATMKALPYHVPYEYIPFAKPDGKSAGSYDEMLHQVLLGNFDAVAGDVTILANRSLLVDFTLPYTESGVTMVVPYKRKEDKNAWIFLKPLTWDLWVASACFFVFMGFVIWILEHQTNEDFSGSHLHQVGTSCWFSFSTMVFAHKEKVVSNLARLVVIIWCFVVLILTQSYTSSLSSLLTIQQLEPSITDLQEIKTKGQSVGYKSNSVVLEFLHRMNFVESQIKRYDSPEDLDFALSNGSIVAAFGEVPYMKLFVTKHCSRYTMVAPTHKNGGFGFVFAKGSPLVPDVSRAILNVTGGEKMAQIENTWIGKPTICQDSRSTRSSSSLSFSSFWGLFLIVGVAASFALIIFTAMLVYEHRVFLMHLDLKAWWRKKKSTDKEAMNSPNMAT